ncbi:MULTISPECIES: hypothetical protein [Bacteroidales]|uniref:hypothetical protein n=1 Tax=Bacteroidales TaxID=171549 RepID=UPI0022E2B8D1|nr:MULTISPECIES: hypothetical protein [Bacteroidales]
MMRREKLIQAILNWKFVYTFWAISYVVYVVLRIFGQAYILTGIPFLVYWGLLGIITTIAGCYHICKRRWIDALLYFCLFPFPLIANVFVK